MRGVKETIQWMGSSPERAALLSPSRRRRCIDHVRQTLGVSERRACRTIGQHRSTQRKVPCGLPDEERLTDDIIELTREFGRHALPGRRLRSNLPRGIPHDHRDAEQQRLACKPQAPLSADFLCKSPAGQWSSGSGGGRG